MKLSPLERSFIRRELKRQSRWLWARWVNAAVSVLVVAASIVNMKCLLALMGDHGAPSNFVVWFWAFCCFVVLSFSGWFVYTLAHWRGDIATSLLIKMVQEHDTDDPSRPTKDR
jgi:hypothetical protein